MRILSVLLLLLISACSTPTTNLPSVSHYNLKSVRRAHVGYAHKYALERDTRIQTIFYNLAQSTGQDLCDRKLRPGLGFDYGTYYSRKTPSFFSGSAAKEEAEDLEKINNYFDPDTIYVRFVMKDSAADKAGLKAQDKIVSIFGQPVNQGEDALNKFNKIMADNTTSAYLGLPVNMEIVRNGKTLNLALKPDEVCPYNLKIDKSFHGINAYADGQSVNLSEEIIDYMNDNELAAVMSHEMAHNTLGHRRAKEINVATGVVAGTMVDILLDTNGSMGISGAAAGANAYSQEFEAEADYVSVYYMARAGYDYKKAPEVQKKLAARNFSSLYGDGTTHPQPQFRYAVLVEAAKEVDIKKGMKGELLPDFQKINSYLRDKQDK